MLEQQNPFHVFSPATRQGTMSASSPSFTRQAVSLGTSYVMGTFNDNFFKQAALLLAVKAGHTAFQSQATFFFALPFVLFSAAAGWLADRYAKKHIVIGAKALEVAAMSVGAWGIIMLDWNWMLAMIFCMGLNSTLFSPALNGSIPELFSERLVPRVNALFKLTTTASILLGIVLSGVALDQQWWPSDWPFGRCLVAAGALGVAVLGLISTFFITFRAGAGSDAPFPKTALLDSARYLLQLRADKALFVVLWGESFFYFISTLLLLEINRLGILQLALSFSMTSLLSVALMVGICVGSLLAAKGSPQSWRVLMVPALGGIALLLAAVWLVPLLPQAGQVPALVLLYTLAGSCGGLYLIPLTSFLQVRPAATDKGKVLGLSNCLSFSGILLAGQLYLLLEPLRPSTGHLALGIFTAAVTLVFAVALRRLPPASLTAPAPARTCP